MYGERNVRFLPVFEEQIIYGLSLHFKLNLFLFVFVFFTVVKCLKNYDIEFLLGLIYRTMWGICFDLSVCHFVGICAVTVHRTTSISLTFDKLTIRLIVLIVMKISQTKRQYYESNKHSLLWLYLSYTSWPDIFVKLHIRWIWWLCPLISLTYKIGYRVWIVYVVSCG